MLVGTVVLVLTACTGAKLPPQASQLDTSAAAPAAAGDPSVTAPPTDAGPSVPADPGAAGAAGGPGVTARTGTTLKGTAKSTATTAKPSANAPGAANTGVGFVPTTLFTDKENTVGLTANSLTMCAHAALTYAPAFNTGPDELNVFWEAVNAEKNGIFGRKVSVTYENDDYKPETAVAAATKCKDKNPFLLLGGIGFDQIPAVRNWAEQNRVPYLHHTATIKGTEGKQFSYSLLPSTEKMGETFAEVIISKYRDKKIGIIKRHSPNWEPGVEAFKVMAKKYNLNIVVEKQVENAQGNYTQELLDMKNAGAEVIMGWENALSGAQMVKQAKAQQWSPIWIMPPVNLTSQTLGDDALNPKLIGVAMYPAYSYGDYSGPFAAYADDLRQFEREYKTYRPNVDLAGVGGDLLFLNWTAQKSLYVLLQKCGQNCTRNAFFDVVRQYQGRPNTSSCDVGLRGTHLGGFQLNIMETYASPSGKVNWRHTNTCAEHLI
jgi:ABC-type branched-subunit amino acid transport system substrate-binding protein